MNRKMKVKTILTLALAATTLAACHRGKKPPRMDNSKLAITTTNLHFIGFNSQSRFFQYDAYRYAMNWIVNRDKIVSDTLDGNAVATVLPIHPNCSLYDTTIASQFSYDPSRCLTELERGGCRDLDADGMLEFALSGMKVDIELNFAVCADNAAKVQEARRIAEDLEAIGIGVNLRQRPDDFSPEVARIATSLKAQGCPADRDALETALAEALCQAFGYLHTPAVYAADYRRLCLNLGQTLRIPDTGETVTALDIDRQYGLVVRRQDGTVVTLRCGEVSVRGLYGYI